MPEKKEEDPLDIHKKKHTYASKLIETHKISGSKAYEVAADKHITDKGGLVDYKLLDDEEVQRKFTKSMVDHHLSEIKRLHGKEAKDDFDKAILMKAYKGITPEEIKESVFRYGSRFTKELYEQQLLPEAINAIRQQLYNVTSEHIEEKHISQITKKLGLEGKLTHSLTVPEARGLLNNWRDQNEQLTDSMLRQILGKKFKKKK